MNIAGYHGVSLIDFPGHICTILFTPGCNFACPFCQNPDLIRPPENSTWVEIDEVWKLLEGRAKFIDGVSITGGEPTLQPDLIDFLGQLRDRNLPVKLDTNGYRPQVLQDVMERELVAFVAMDFKTSLERYPEAAGRPVNLEKLETSIELLRNGKVPYEFRTTVVPDLVTETEIEQIGRRIEGARSWRLHQFSNRKTYDPALADLKPYVPDRLRALAELGRKYVADTKTRGI